MELNSLTIKESIQHKPSELFKIPQEDQTDIEQIQKIIPGWLWNEKI